MWSVQKERGPSVDPRESWDTGKAWTHGKRGPVEQNASLGTPAGALGLLHLRYPRRHWHLQTVTGREGGRGEGVLIFLTPRLSDM